MKKDNLFIKVWYENYKDGVSNLQMAQIYQVTNTGDKELKTFTSLKSKALDRAKSYLKKITK